MTFEWPSWVNPLPFPFPELHNIKQFYFYHIFLAFLQISVFFGFYRTMYLDKQNFQ